MRGSSRVVDKPVDAGFQRRRVVLRQVAHLPLEGAVARDDVDRGAAGDRADRHRRVRRVEAAVGPRARRAPAACSRPISRMISAAAADRADPEIGRARMPLASGDPGAEERQPLLPIGDLHRGRLADDRHRRPRQALAARTRISAGAPRQPTSSSWREGEMQRHRQRAPRRLRDQRQREGDKALHVGRAAAIEPAVASRSARTGRCAIPARRPARHRYGRTGSRRRARRSGPGPIVANRLALPSLALLSVAAMPCRAR